MRKNLNTVKVEGYLYDKSKLQLRETGENSKNPGTIYIGGELNIAVDEEALNVIPVYFTYVTEFYSKSGKPNNTFTLLKRILEEDDNTWLEAGKENATKLRIDGNIGINDFVNAQDEMISVKRVEGSFVRTAGILPDENERNTFQADMVITSVAHVDADPEKYIEEDFTKIRGAVFNFRNDLLPVEFQVHNKAGMEYFENLDITGAEPVYTKVWGHINNEVIKVEHEEESAFGEASITTYDRTNRQWIITGTAKVPYDFGDEEVMTEDELKVAAQDREVYLADVRKRNEEYKASLKDGANDTETPTAKKKETINPGGFNF